MKRPFAGWLGLVFAFWMRSALGAEEAQSVHLINQHADFRAVYAPGTTNELYLVVHDSDGQTNYASTNVVLVVRESARTEIPPGFETFGEAGSPIWILPASQDPQLLYLGISGEGLPSGTFADPPVMELKAVQAPGWFFVWQFGSGGDLNLRMDSRNGIGTEDAMPIIAGSHAHVNWGFTRNGVFEVTLQMKGRLAGSATNLVTQPSIFRFEVEPVPVGPAAPAVLSNVIAVEGQLRCDLTGEPGALYQLQSSFDLVSWSDVERVTAGSSALPVSVALPVDGRPLFLRATNP